MVRECSSFVSFLTSKKAAMQNLNSVNIKRDRSMKGEVDSEIKPLLESINAKPHLFTTSSCAGRIQILATISQMRPFRLYQSHEGIEGGILQQLSSLFFAKQKDGDVLPVDGDGLDCASRDIMTKHRHLNVDKEWEPQSRSERDGILRTPEEDLSLLDIRLICQGPILHVALPSIGLANHLMTLLQHHGIKQTTIRSITSTRIIVSCASTTNISVILWLANCGWLVNLQSNLISEALAEAMTKEMLHSRELYFKIVNDVINMEYFN